MAEEAHHEVVPRAYQLEMLELSLQRNIIVAMNTGSGKTQIAILRTRSALEKDASKRVWFLCPTVTLAEQQGKEIQQQLLAYQVRVLTGRNGVDSWSDQQTWDAVLLNVNIVVSTHQILLDALRHAFVKLRSLSLLVFDEAHHCKDNHPANKILQQFYHPHHRVNANETPAVLGLTASPSPNGRSSTLNIIEQNLNALSKTPKFSRRELLRFVHLPAVEMHTYQNTEMPRQSSLNVFFSIFAKLDINEDPYVIHLQNLQAFRKHSELVQSRKTNCQETLRHLLATCCNIHDELGPWSCEKYLIEVVERFRSLQLASHTAVVRVEEQEKDYIYSILTRVVPHFSIDDSTVDERLVSVKVNILIDLIVELTTPDSAGIVFVKTRAAVYALTKLLRAHKKTRHLIRVGYFVGTSAYVGRSPNIVELLDARDQKENLNELRSGALNLIVCTSVCEEGIDISACNFVIGFEPPPNLKSFIQRRGRARSKQSKFVILFSESERNRISNWQSMEQVMIATYQDDMRKLAQLQQLESEEEDYRELVVNTTGAILTLESAVPHLFHFTNKLPKTPHVSNDPIFMFEQEISTSALSSDSVNGSSLFKCRIMLPNSVDGSVRETQSHRYWKSQEMARKDAALECCRALFHAGLLNENLLPTPLLQNEIAQVLEETTIHGSLTLISGAVSPWTSVASMWRLNAALHRYVIRIGSTSDGNHGDVLLMLSPLALPEMRSFLLHLDGDTTVVVTILGDNETVQHNADDIETARLVTRMMLSSFSAHVDERLGFPLLFIPIDILGRMNSWYQSVKGTSEAKILFNEEITPEKIGIVRHKIGRRYRFHGITRERVSSHEPYCPGEFDSETRPRLILRKCSKRMDFLHQIPSANASKELTVEYWDPEDFTVDRLSATYSDMAKLIPCIMHKIGTTLSTESCCSTILTPIGFSSSANLLPALCTPAAREQVDYQRLEFLGDGLLKFMTASTLIVSYLHWHEGYLSPAKDRIVSNARLAQAALKTGLDAYILTSQFTGYKWRPIYNEEVEESPTSPQREIGTKVLADVVEAVIGAAFVDGDGSLTKVLPALKIFLPELSWADPKQQAEILFDVAGVRNVVTLPQFAELERLVGRTFANKALLLEAITPPSCVDTSAGPSYQRLEFLGDAILDYIVTTRIFSHASAELRVHHMHLLRTATVNAAFLAFCALRHTISIEVAEVGEQTQSEPANLTMTQKSLSLPLFIRHPPIPELAAALAATRLRYAALEETISSALYGSGEYPWRAFAAFEPEKVYSDTVESTLAAVFVDTKGDFAACERMLDQFGILKWLDTAVRTGLKVWHPKEELGAIAAEKRVTYDTWIMGEEEGGIVEPIDLKSPSDLSLGVGRWKCKVWVENSSICEVNGWNKYEAETAGAEKAVAILRRKKEDLKKL